jgi:rhodanese-related sulfurtransferase
MIIDFIQTNLMLVVLVFVSGGLFFWSFFDKTGKGLSPSEATLLINRDQAKILDVREPSEFANGHLPDAMNIPLGELVKRQQELESFKEFPLLVYCASGGRSSRACSDLTKQGFNKLHNLDGGVAAWQHAGLPVRKPGKGRHK